MDKQFTASEVRTESCKQGQLHRQPASDMLNAFADLLEAREIARNDAIEREYERENNPAPSDAERLAEALRQIALTTEGYPNAYEGVIARNALAARSAQAQRPAASVPVDAVMRVIDGQRRLPYRSIDEKQAFRNALDAALAAQENPNG